MKFLLNMNVAEQLGRELEVEGHVWRHVSRIGMSRATDAQIIAEAERAEETILTHDLDYGKLLAFSGARRPSVVILRLRRLQASDLAHRVSTVWPSISDALTQGAVVIVEEGGVRIR